jgi:hypothetical protein
MKRGHENSEFHNFRYPAAESQLPLQAQQTLFI